MSKPAPADAEASGTAGSDPSMDDILASIRRILSEESAAVTPPGTAADADDVLELDNSMLLADAPQPAPARPDAAPVPSPEEPLPLAIPEIKAAEPAMTSEPLIAPQTASAAIGAMGNLVRNLEAQRQSAIYRGGPTLEDIAREEIRPLLKSWLDNNLPDMVERIVRSEIERIAGRVA